MVCLDVSHAPHTKARPRQVKGAPERPSATDEEAEGAAEAKEESARLCREGDPGGEPPPAWAWAWAWAGAWVRACSRKDETETEPCR